MLDTVSGGSRVILGHVRGLLELGRSLHQRRTFAARTSEWKVPVALQNTAVSVTDNGMAAPFGI